MLTYKELVSEEYQEYVKKCWDDFINDRESDFSRLRPEVLESWIRSKAYGINPHEIVKLHMDDKALREELNAYSSVLSITRPYVQKLYSIVEGTGAYILISNKDGYLLDVIGDRDMIIEGASISKLYPGACRAESVSGSNAIGLALSLNKPVQLWGSEHYIEWHKPFACAGAPFYDENNNVLGAIDVTMLMKNAQSHTLGMVMSAADAITREIKLRSALNKLESLNNQRNMIIENMTSGVLLLNPKGSVIQANNTALQMLGLERETVIGQNLFNFISINNNNDYQWSLDFLNKQVYNIECIINIMSNPLGSNRFNISINHIKDSKGEITAVLFRINRPEIIQKLVKRIEGYHAKYDFDDIIGQSDEIVTLKNHCRKAAKSDSNILIIGPSGTGKELIAQSIHNASPVAKGPFVAINCASIPNSLVESELFGYESGSFTGASKEGRPGKFELADGGTIFLDEIGDMPLNVQATLLRVIQTREVTRIGSSKPKAINIRIIAATNQDLLQAIEEKNFRSDLFYRLNVFTVNVPTLKERGPLDILLIAEHFIKIYNASHGTHYHLTDEAKKALSCYSWPGNVRQLENVLERAITLADNDELTLNQLPIQIASLSNGKIELPKEATPIVEESNEKDVILKALEETRGNITEVSNMLNINRRTLYRHMEKFGINPEQYR